MSDHATDRSFESLTVGETYAREHLISKEMVDSFAGLSGDKNPLHVDADYVAKTTFKKPLAHGMLLGALVSELIGMHLPGKRCLLLKESLAFHHPVFIGDAVRIIGELRHKSEALHVLEIAIVIMREHETVADGIVHTKVL